MPSAAITLRVHCGGMRWRLSDTDRVEVWRGTTLLGVLTGRTLTILIEHQLLAIEVAGWLHADADTEKAPALPARSPPASPRRPPLALPSRVAFTDDERATQKAKRRTRRKA